MDSTAGSSDEVGLGTADGSAGGGGEDSGCAGAAGVSVGGVAGAAPGAVDESGAGGSLGAGLEEGSGAGTSCGGDRSQPATAISHSAAASVRSAIAGLVIFTSLDADGEVVVTGRALGLVIAAIGAVVDVDEVVTRGGTEGLALTRRVRGIFSTGCKAERSGAVHL